MITLLIIIIIIIVIIIIIIVIIIIIIIIVIIIIIIIIIMWSFIYSGGSMWNVTNSSLRINGVVRFRFAYFAVRKVSQY